MPDPSKMVEAARLTRAGRLAEATTLIRRMLGGEATPGAADEIASGGRKSPTIDASAETIEAKDRPPLLETVPSAPPHVTRALRALLHRVTRLPGLGLPGLMEPAPLSTPDIVPDGGKFIEATYSNAAGSRAYKLYIPSRHQGEALPLVVMLHGCGQSPDDFAAGTRMNAIAEEETCLVVYPAQPSDANPGKCWNWVRPADQLRGLGEASLGRRHHRQVMRDYAVDPRRVYIGGLSAESRGRRHGGNLPDLYAAIGVHSGLACGPPPTCSPRSPSCGKVSWRRLATFYRLYPKGRRSRPSSSRRPGYHGAPAQRRSCHGVVDAPRARTKQVQRGRVAGGPLIRARSTPTRTGARSSSAGTFMEPDTPGREAAPPAPSPTRADRMRRGNAALLPRAPARRGDDVKGDRPRQRRRAPMVVRRRLPGRLLFLLLP